MIKNSELILNPDGSVYHLNLKPENIAKNIIFVGDQDRVEAITSKFDSITFSTQKREFKTQTGIYKNTPLTVISTGIGADNIDIVMNELDALVNINLDSKTINKELTSLNIIRIGTSGAIQKDIPLDSFLVSQYAIGLDNMLRSYMADNHTETDIEKAFISQTNWDSKKGQPYCIKASEKLIKLFENENIINGFTATSGGFYGPQGRILRLPIQDAELNTKMENFSFNNLKLTNLEMETAAIYGLGKLLGHHTISLNAIIANRSIGEFSNNPNETIENLINFTLEKLKNII